MSKKLISFISVLAAITVMLCSCAKQDSGETQNNYTDKGQTKIVEISLPYASSDSLNPYFATGYENVALSYIFCQPLFTVKSDYSCEPIVASEYTVKDKSVTVSINEIFFSDGDRLNAEDVVYSFNLAKKSPVFSQRLKNISSAHGSYSSVTFTLNSPDKLAACVLTFPIVKRGTGDKADAVPTGSGVFMFSGKEQMTVNPYCQKQTAINSVTLCDIKTLGNAVSELEIGNINYLFEDFSEGKFKGIVSESKNITINNLVYLGINSNSGALSSSAVRTAIYYAIDKENASATPYQGYAVAAATPFNPDFYELKNVKMPSVKGDKTKARSIIEKLGYNSGSKNGTQSASGNELHFSLIVNNNNSFRVAAANKIAQELRECGFRIDVIPMSADKYKTKINEGDYQLCIAEAKLSENMDLSAFSDGFYKKSVPENLKFFNDYKSYKAGGTDMNALVDSFLNDMPFVPICYRVGVAAYTKTYTPDFTYAPFNIYGNIENWEAVK